ncbi:programmed cell death protein 2 [Mortierella sp. GBAus27b]|nr:programmed cell death protein 2 [Mortierella sp. GBAus27b]
MSNTGNQHPSGHAEEESQVMLGFAEPVDLEEQGPLRAEDFCSKIGGLPLWLNPENVLNTKEMMCDQCHKPMAFLLQLYSPEDHPAEAFHRMIYVFCCKNGTCHKESPRGCFKVVRSQLGKYNPYYTPVSKDDENAEKENAGWKPFPINKHAKTCFVCGMYGPKVCSKCHKASYCDPEHQTLHWTKGLHNKLCGVTPPSPPTSSTDHNLADLTISNNAASQPDADERDEYLDEENAVKKKANNLTKEQKDHAKLFDADNRLVERIARFPELEIISESEVFSQEAIEDGLADDSSGDEQEAEEGWEEKAAAIRARKEQRAQKKGESVSNSLKPAETSMNALVPVGDEIYENTRTDIDAAFLTFQKRIALYPDQVLRYARMEYELTTPQPLYVSDIGIPKSEDIPPCPDCGRERTFEFQILPQLLNYLAIDHSANNSLDFGTVLIYSCKDNCHVDGKHYQHEVALVQHFSEDGMQGGNMTAGPSVSVAN